MGSIEEALAELESLEPGKRINYTQVAKKYSVDRSTLSKRHRGVQRSRSYQYENQQVLNNEQSKTLIKWINDLTERGLPPSHEMLRNFAKEISGNRPGKNWPTRWLKTHSDELISRFTTGMDKERKRADSAFKYTIYFERLGRKIQEYGIEPRQMYNMDEKGFLIGVLAKMKRIFSRRQYEKGSVKQMLQDGNREWITAIASICADGTALSPGLIYQAASGKIQDTWLQDFDPSEHKCFFASSESGWTNEELGYHWLVTIFDRETKQKARSHWRLLILDGHGSHVNMKFINYCDANKILLAIFPSHSTHTLQPLDVALFGPLSTAYSAELAKFMQDCQGLSSITKRDFFRFFWKAWVVAFTPKNILSGWAATGLEPWDPERILLKFTREPDERPSSSESSKSVLKAEDWRRIRNLLKEVVTDIYDERTQKLNNTLMALSTENILLQLRCKGLEDALVNEKKRRKRGKPLLLELDDGGGVFYSPSKVQRARELQLEKEEAARLARSQKKEDKIRREHEKLEKRSLVEERKRMRVINKEMRLQEQEKKRRQKEDEKLARLANIQLQNDIRQDKKSKKKTQKTPSVGENMEIGLAAVTEVVEAPTAANRSGRQLRLPERYRN
jgi:hypothetical protein